MKRFLVVMIILFAFQIFGQAICLAKQDDKRNLSLLPLDILVGIGLMGWAIHLLDSL